MLAGVVGADAGAGGVARASAVGAVLSDAITDLPAYVVGEAVVTNSDQLLGLLIATDVSPLITPWASLAIIIWCKRCRSAGVPIAWGRFVATGAVVALIAAEGALLLSGG